MTETTPLPLTPRQEAIYRWMHAFHTRKGYPPTYREIQDAFDIHSPNGVVANLSAMEKKGWVSLEGRGESGPRARCMRFLRDPEMAPVRVPGCDHLRGTLQGIADATGRTWLLVPGGDIILSQTGLPIGAYGRPLKDATAEELRTGERVEPRGGPDRAA